MIQEQLTSEEKRFQTAAEAIFGPHLKSHGLRYLLSLTHRQVRFFENQRLKRWDPKTRSWVKHPLGRSEELVFHYVPERTFTVRPEQQPEYYRWIYEAAQRRFSRDGVSVVDFGRPFVFSRGRIYEVEEVDEKPRISERTVEFYPFEGIATFGLGL